MPLVHELEAVNAFLHTIDGIIITGGAFDVDPALFGAQERRKRDPRLPNPKKAQDRSKGFP